MKIVINIVNPQVVKARFNIWSNEDFEKTLVEDTKQTVGRLSNLLEEYDITVHLEKEPHDNVNSHSNP